MLKKWPPAYRVMLKKWPPVYRVMLKKNPGKKKDSTNLIIFNMTWTILNRFFAVL